jgi:hypothetical protein
MIARSWLVASGLGIGGALAGVAAKLADESPLTWAADLGTYPALWLAAVAVIGRLSPTPAQAALRAVVFILAMCVAYYAWAELVFGFIGSFPWLLTWSVLGATLVPLAAAGTWWASRHRGIGPGAVIALVAGAAFIDGRLYQYLLLWAGILPADFPAFRPVQAAFSLAVALLIAGVLPAKRLTRAWALVLTIPLAAVAYQLVQSIYGAI